MSLDAIRSAILGYKQFKSELFTYGDITVELREPNVGTRKAILEEVGIMKQAAASAAAGKEDFVPTVDPIEMQVVAIIALCYVPGTEQKVFNMADKEALYSLPSALFDGLAKAATTLLGVTKGVGDVAKK